MQIDAERARRETGKGGESQVGEKLPLIKYEPDSKYMGKLWLIAAIGISICAVVYVLGTVFSNSIMTGISLISMVALCAILFLVYRKIRSSSQALDEEEIDKMVERYKADLIDTFNGYDLDYDAHEILTEADRYRRMLEDENGVSELGEDESFASIFEKMMSDSKESRAKRKQDKREDRARRKEDRAFAKQMKREQNTR